MAEKIKMHDGFDESSEGGEMQSFIFTDISNPEEPIALEVIVAANAEQAIAQYELTRGKLADNPNIVILTETPEDKA